MVQAMSFWERSQASDVTTSHLVLIVPVCNSNNNSIRSEGSIICQEHLPIMSLKWAPLLCLNILSIIITNRRGTKVCLYFSYSPVLTVDIASLYKKLENQALNSKWQPLLEVVGLVWGEEPALMWFEQYCLYIGGFTSKLKVNADTKLPQRGWSVPYLEDVGSSGDIHEYLVGYLDSLPVEQAVISTWLPLSMRIKLWLLFAYNSFECYAFAEMVDQVLENAQTYHVLLSFRGDFDYKPWSCMGVKNKNALLM